MPLGIALFVATLLVFGMLGFHSYNAGGLVFAVLIFVAVVWTGFFQRRR